VVAVAVDARQFLQHPAQPGPTLGPAQARGFNPQAARNVMDVVTHRDNLANGSGWKFGCNRSPPLARWRGRELGNKAALNKGRTAIACLARRRRDRP
ncbi:hypothetical protein RZS08_25815, partial [Arthrospira platensis SPKY1]|nr:hypothetical protein [Arthrospira platensis SPKY1]